MLNSSAGILRYSLLPFRFISLDADSYVLTNLGGEYLVAPREKLDGLYTASTSYEPILFTSTCGRVIFYLTNTPR